MASHTSFLTFILLIFVSAVGVFYLARIIRFLINFIRYIILNNRHKPKNNSSKKFDKKPPKFSKNDSKFRDKKNEIQLANQRSRSKQELDFYEETKIVGIAEPVGKWTKYVTNQKISWLQAMVGSKMESDSFWQNMIKAQQRAASKHKGRSGPGI